MNCIDTMAASENGKRFINIRDAACNYKTAFYLEDGKDLTLIYPNGEKHTAKCSYIGAYHFYFGTNCYHIDQFAELVNRNNIRLQPEEYVTDLNLYVKSYMDRELKDSAGKLIPYRSIVELENDSREMQLIAVCPHARLDRQVAFLDCVGKTPPEKTFYSIQEAKAALLPNEKIHDHERRLLMAVFNEVDRGNLRITEQEYDKIPESYKGQYQDYDGRHPEWKGKRTAFLPGHGTTLFIEGVSFLIDDSYRKPPLSSQVKAAAAKSEHGSKATPTRTEPTHDR